MKRGGIGDSSPTTALCLIAIMLGGCASATHPLAQARANAPVRVVVMQAPMAVDAGRLQKVLEPDTKQALSASEEPLLRGAEHAQEHASSAMAAALAQAPNLIVVTPPPAAQELIAHIRSYGAESAITQDEADRLRAATGADVLLRFRITDYGLTPQSWRHYYIAFEVVTTLAIAAVIAYAKPVAAKAAAGAYLVEETVEETATAYAGFWALDEVSRPVRIEAELTGLNPVATLLTTSDTGFSDVVLSRLIRKVSADERNRQLDQATDHAVKKIIADVSRSLETSRRAQLGNQGNTE